MKQIEKERFFTMAETYDKVANVLVPHYDFLQNEIFNIISFPKDKDIKVIDLGAGSGILLEKVLEQYPQSKCVWLDYSDDFKKIAESRLKKYKNRVEFILSPIESDWITKTDRKFDLIVSMSAIHHLESQEKQNLYRRCYELLNPSGWFFNIDEMKTLSTDAYKNSLIYWVNFVNSMEEKIPAKQIKYYAKWRSHFDNWKLRNVDNFDIPKQKGDDLHDTFVDQIEWLQKAGFKNPDVFVKYHLWSIIGGQK